MKVKSGTSRISDEFYLHFIIHEDIHNSFSSTPKNSDNGFEEMLLSEKQMKIRIQTFKACWKEHVPEISSRLDLKWIFDCAMKFYMLFTFAYFLCLWPFITFSNFLTEPRSRSFPLFKSMHSLKYAWGMCIEVFPCALPGLLRYWLTTPTTWATSIVLHPFILSLPCRTLFRVKIEITSLLILDLFQVIGSEVILDCKTWSSDFQKKKTALL